jgi:AhpD family alkylhydroperoxidase
MQQRIDYNSAAPDVVKAMLHLEASVRRLGLEPSLLELVKMRASQINGCAYCIDMHSKDALAEGETVQRLLLLDAWREAPIYSERERAALAWTEAVTRISEGGASDEVYQQAVAAFGEKDLANLTLAVIAINGWNRLSIAFRVPPSYERPAT